MTFNADEPAISGACYTVVDVDGHPPAALADFARDAAMTLLMNGQTRRVIGSGAHRSGSVRFHQKDPGPDGKDVRVWTITVRGDLSWPNRWPRSDGPPCRRPSAVAIARTGAGRLPLPDSARAT